MEYLPEDFSIGQMRAEYKNQAYLGDVLVPKVALLEDRFLVVLEKTDGTLSCIVEFKKREI